MWGGGDIKEFCLYGPTKTHTTINNMKKSYFYTL